jgi:probable rRNA maturation factor
VVTLKTPAVISHSLDIANEDRAPWLRPLALSVLTEVVLLPECHSFTAPLELSLLLTDDVGIRELNNKWRGIDEATDVLAFPLEEGACLGDVVISMDTAKQRVDLPDWLLEDEVLFLLLHGVLHLLGYDHIEEDERAHMEAQEQALWTALGRSGTLRANLSVASR